MKSLQLSLILLAVSLVVTAISWIIGPSVLLSLPVCPSHPFSLQQGPYPALHGMWMGNHRQRALLPL